MHANEAVVGDYNLPRGRPKSDAFSTRGLAFSTRGLGQGAEEI